MQLYKTNDINIITHSQREFNFKSPNGIVARHHFGKIGSGSKKNTSKCQLCYNVFCKLLGKCCCCSCSCSWRIFQIHLRSSYRADLGTPQSRFNCWCRCVLVLVCFFSCFFVCFTRHCVVVWSLGCPGTRQVGQQERRVDASRHLCLLRESLSREPPRHHCVQSNRQRFP